MIGTNQLHIGPDDRFDPHLSSADKPMIGVDDGSQHLSLFFTDDETYRRFARAVVDGLALLHRGQMTSDDIADAEELCIRCDGGEPFLIVGDERLCAGCATVEVQA